MAGVQVSVLHFAAKVCIYTPRKRYSKQICPNPRTTDERAFMQVCSTGRAVRRGGEPHKTGDRKTNVHRYAEKVMQ
jgi:hypothetical protein